MSRLFIALDLPRSAREAVYQLRDELDGARWTPSANLHLTLRFLGETSEARATEVETALREVTACPPMLRTTGLTVFPSRRRPRVLVVAFEKTDALMELHQQVETAVCKVDFEPEARAFRPHVTFARLKQANRRAVVRYLRTHQAPDVSCTPRTLYLYESVLHPDGAQHHHRAAFELKG